MPVTNQIVVQIKYDRAKTKYVAKDIKTGLRILWHQDSARLRAICDRMKWEIVEDDIEEQK